MCTVKKTKVFGSDHVWSTYKLLRRCVANGSVIFFVTENRKVGNLNSPCSTCILYKLPSWFRLFVCDKLAVGSKLSCQAASSVGRSPDGSSGLLFFSSETLTNGRPTLRTGGWGKKIGSGPHL
jgi:hypothetical protein